MTDTLDRLTAALADRYAIERVLGTGGMATVYLAEDLKHRRKVALKVLRPELAATLGPDRFVREIEIAAGLTHPHILPLYDSGDADGFLYYVMPYVEGESLRDRLERGGKVSVEDAIRIADQVASALSHAHQHGVVHRDIKPENILLAGDQAIVADFGIARAVEAAGGERLTGTGVAIGTPAYMSPEQAMGLAEVDARSDVYALGCVVYEMVGGRAPFEGTTPRALLAKHAADIVPGLRARDPTIPVFVERAVERALAKSPEDRFQTPRDFAEALTTGTVVARVGRPRWRRRTVAGAAAGIVLLAVAGWWLAATAGDPAMDRLAVLPFANFMNDPEQEYLVQGVHDALISELQQAGVTVIARTSVMQYRNTEKPVRAIARELAVDAIIEGSVLRTGDSVQIEARLVHGGTEESLWRQVHRGDIQNVVAIYRELTRAMAREVQFALTPQAEARLGTAPTVNPQAYEAYLKGRFHWSRLTPADLETALQYFQVALNNDREYALAYAGIATVWASRQQMGFVPPDEAAPRMKEAAARALELDSTLAEVHSLLAAVKTWLDWDWDGGETAFRRAIAINPNYPDARALYSLLLMILGRPREAMAQIEHARRLDPLNDLFQTFYGMDLLAARRYDDAIAQFRNAIKTAPNNPAAQTGLRDALHAQGRYDEALAALKALFAGIGEPELEAAVDRGYADGGYRAAVRHAAEMWTARSTTTFVLPVDLAALFAIAGERDRALEWLERAYEVRDPNLPAVGWLPVFDDVRDDPRFQNLLRRMNLSSRVGG